MLTIINFLSEKSIIRYIFIGGSSFLIELGVIFFATHLFDTSPLIAVAISFWIGLVVSFVLQKVITFQNKEKKPEKLAYQMTAYGILIVINYTFTLFVVATLENSIGAYEARTLALAITTVWNYLIYQKIIFKKNM